MNFQKPKFWDYKKPNLLSYFLLPFTFPLIVNNFFLKLKKKKFFPFTNQENLCWQHICRWNWKDTFGNQNLPNFRSVKI